MRVCMAAHRTAWRAARGSEVLVGILEGQLRLDERVGGGGAMDLLHRLQPDLLRGLEALADLVRARDGRVVTADGHGDARLQEALDGMRRPALDGAGVVVAGEAALH